MTDKTTEFERDFANTQPETARERARLEDAERVMREFPAPLKTTKKLTFEVNPDRFLSSCSYPTCGMDGVRIVDLSGFKDAPPDARKLFRLHCEVCDRRFVGQVVEVTQNA